MLIVTRNGVFQTPGEDSNIGDYRIDSLDSKPHLYDELGVAEKICVFDTSKQTVTTYVVDYVPAYLARCREEAIERGEIYLRLERSACLDDGIVYLEKVEVATHTGRVMWRAGDKDEHK